LGNSWARFTSIGSLQLSSLIFVLIFHCHQTWLLGILHAVWIVSCKFEIWWKHPSLIINLYLLVNIVLLHQLCNWLDIHYHQRQAVMGVWIRIYFWKMIYIRIKSWGICSRFLLKIQTLMGMVGVWILVDCVDCRLVFLAKDILVVFGVLDARLFTHYKMMVWINLSISLQATALIIKFSIKLSCDLVRVTRWLDITDCLNHWIGISAATVITWQILVIALCLFIGHFTLDWSLSSVTNSHRMEIRLGLGLLGRLLEVHQIQGVLFSLRSV